MMCKQMMQVGRLKTVGRSKQIIKRSHVTGMSFKRSLFIFGFLGMLWTDWTLQTTDVQTGSLGPSS